VPLSDANIIGLYGLLGAVVPSLIPVVVILLSNRSAQRAREAISKSVSDMHKTVDEVKAQTDGVIEKISALAESAGVAKGNLAGQKTGEATGKARAEEVQAIVTEAVDAAAKGNTR